MEERHAAREHEIIQRLAERGIAFRVHEHVVSRTVADAVATLPFPPEQYLKTVVFRVKNGPWVLAACRGADRVKYRKLAAALGVKRAEIVQPARDEVEDALGYAIGGICPIPPDGTARTIIDATAAATLDIVFCGIGRNDRTLEIRIADLIAAAQRPDRADYPRAGGWRPGPVSGFGTRPERYPHPGASKIRLRRR
jgi:Cys-tRNA(Pro)/Cys-tRNA(Cys) deacylase